MATVRAKFRCDDIHDQFEGKSVTLHAVYADSPENKEFFQATPSGTIEVYIKSAAAEKFTAGANYYVDFTPAE